MSLTFDEILAGARDAVSRGYGTVVMQSGEDPALDVVGLCEVIREIKSETALAVTLSLGERRDCELRAFKEAGADRWHQVPVLGLGPVE